MPPYPRHASRPTNFLGWLAPGGGRNPGGMATGYAALTPKEKETLRLILQGHDAKSMANALDLSVHTVNERLRAARRKLEVTSSKEAARLLLEEEGAAPQLLVPKELGDAAAGMTEPGEPTAKARTIRAWIVGGILAMSLLFALALVSQTGSPVAFASSEQTANAAAQDAETQAVARAFLEQIDRSDWAGSYATATAKFRETNTLQVWSDVSEQVRAPLGELVSRTLVSNEWVPTPEGYVLVKFRSDFANRKDVTETVTLVREDGEWAMSGIIVD